MLNNRFCFSSLLMLIGISCSPLAWASPIYRTPSSATSAPSMAVCQACEAGNGAYPTLEAQNAACQACEAQENAFAVAASQPIPSTSTPSSFHWASRWYLGLGGGWSRPSTTGQNIFTVSGSSAPDVYEMANTENSYLYGGDLGLAFKLGRNWFPTGYLTANSWEIGSYDSDATRTHGTNTYGADINTEVFTALFNASVDIYRWYGLAPFVGGGGGWAEAYLGSFTDNFQSGATLTPMPFSFASHHTQLFVYDIVAGLHYQMGDHWQLQLNYMYLPIGNIATGAGTSSDGKVLPAQDENLTSNNLLLAIHFIF